MSESEPLQELPTEVEELRARATRCRDYAREYATDVGTSLSELAVELDRKADRIEALGEPADHNGDTISPPQDRH